MSPNEMPTKWFIIRVGPIYTPSCLEPVTVQVKCHQRFRKLSQVTLQGSYQRQAITWGTFYFFKSKPAMNYDEWKESNQPQHEGPCWTRCGPPLLGPNRFSASSPLKLRLPDGTDPAGHHTPRLQHKSLPKGCFLFDGLSLTSSLMPVLSSMWIHCWTGRAISLLLWDRCACRGSPYTLWVERLRGGPEESDRMSESATSRVRHIKHTLIASSFHLSDCSSLWARWCFCSGTHVSFCDTRLAIQ